MNPVRNVLLRVAYEIVYRLRKQHFVARTIEVKFRHGRTFETFNRALTLDVPTDDEHTVYGVACAQLDHHWDRRRPLRLVGATLSGFSPDVQLSLFEAEQDQRQDRLHQAIDGLRGRFGRDIIMPAALLPRPQDHPQERRPTPEYPNSLAG